jgi:WD40 repeat protein
VSDEDNGPAEFLINAARRRQSPPPQPPAGRVTVTRVGHFHGNFPGAFWLSAAWSPDSSQLAFGGKTQFGHGYLEVWNGESGHHEGFAMRHLTHGAVGPVISLAWAPDSRHLATLESEHKSGRLTVHVRSQADRSRAISLPPGLAASQVTWSPDGTLLALSGPHCPHTVLMDPADGSQRRVLDGVSGPVAWEPEGRLIAGVHGTDVVLCDRVTGERVRALTEHKHVPAALAWARHGKYLAVADGEEIRVWNAESGAWRWKLPWATAEGDRGPDPTVTAMDWLDGGGYLLEFRQRGGAWRDEQGSTVSTIVLWDIETGKSQFVQRFYETRGTSNRRHPIAGLALAPDHRRLALAFDTATPSIWQITGDLPNYQG